MQTLTVSNVFVSYFPNVLETQYNSFKIVSISYGLRICDKEVSLHQIIRSRDIYHLGTTWKHQAPKLKFHVWCLTSFGLRSRRLLYPQSWRKLNMWIFFPNINSSAKMLIYSNLTKNINWKNRSEIKNKIGNFLGDSTLLSQNFRLPVTEVPKYL